MSMDYSEICIGEPREVIGRLTRRLGELNFGSANMKIGVTGNPCQTRAALEGVTSWRVMKLLYVTHSFVQAREMAALLKAWDAKLFVDEEQCDPPLGGRRTAHRFYAYALIR